MGATFARRQTDVPDGTPVGLCDAFAADEVKRLRWAAFLRKMGASAGSPAAPELAGVVATIAPSLLPALRPKADE